MKLKIDTTNRTIEVIEPYTTQEFYNEIKDLFDKEEMCQYLTPIECLVSTIGPKLFVMINGWKVINKSNITGSILVQ